MSPRHGHCLFVWVVWPSICAAACSQVPPMSCCLVMHHLHSMLLLMPGPNMHPACHEQVPACLPPSSLWAPTTHIADVRCGRRSQPTAACGALRCSLPQRVAAHPSPTQPQPWHRPACSPAHPCAPFRWCWLAGLSSRCMQRSRSSMGQPAGLMLVAWGWGWAMSMGMGR